MVNCYRKDLGSDDGILRVPYTLHMLDGIVYHGHRCQVLRIFNENRRLIVDEAQ